MSNNRNTAMICCNETYLYIEEEPRFHCGEYGDYAVMCFNCGWIDKYIYWQIDKADDRRIQLNKERERTSPNK